MTFPLNSSKRETGTARIYREREQKRQERLMSEECGFREEELLQRGAHMALVVQMTSCTMSRAA